MHIEVDRDECINLVIIDQMFFYHMQRQIRMSCSCKASLTSDRDQLIYIMPIYCLRFFEGVEKYHAWKEKHKWCLFPETI